MTTDEDARGAPKRTAAARVLSVIDAFSHGNGTLRLTEIARHAELPLSTAHRLVGELVAWDGVEVDGEGRYRLSRKLLDLASTSAQAFRMRELAIPHLVDLHRATGLTVQFGARDGRDVVYLDALRAHPNWSGENRIGGRLPLHVAATGLVLLAHADAGEVDDYLAGEVQRFTPHTPVTRERVSAVLERTRRDGVCIAERHVSLDVGAVAAPVRDRQGAVVAALGAVYVVGQHAPAPLADLVRAVAARISATLAEPAPGLDPRTVDFNRRRLGLGGVGQTRHT